MKNLTFAAYNFVNTIYLSILKKRFLNILFIALFSAICLGWGNTGHYKINNNAVLSFNQEMSQFQQWALTLANNASEADYRKGWDPNESPRHYIDIDNYNEFNSTGRIPQTLDSVIMIHGATFVYDQGVLPWATLKTFDSLSACFERKDWDKAVLFAADLGHYIADGHMPLHITRNYNGQFSGNSGIHSRYESTMINAYGSQIEYSGYPIEEIQDVGQYVFDYLYANYTYVDSVIDADDYAKNLAGGSTSSSVYKQALWEKTRGFTTTLFKNASHSLAEMIYTAWLLAGSPQMSSSGIFDEIASPGIQLEQNMPNPFVKSTTIKFTLPERTLVQLQVCNVAGKNVASLIDTKMEQGTHSFEWTPGNLPGGLYYLILKSGNSSVTRKMVLME
jgi:hypothetical protein